MLVCRWFLLHSWASHLKVNLCECLPVLGCQDGARARVNSQEGKSERERKSERDSSTAVT